MLKTDLIRAKAIQLHFASVVAQASFVNERDNYLSTTDKALKENSLKQMKKHALRELEIVREFLSLVLQDPTLGYESSNQYFYVPQDLKEKYINIQHTLEWLKIELKNLSKSKN